MSTPIQFPANPYPGQIIEVNVDVLNDAGDIDYGQNITYQYVVITDAGGNVTESYWKVYGAAERGEQAWDDKWVNHPGDTMSGELRNFNDTGDQSDTKTFKAKRYNPLMGVIVDGTYDLISRPLMPGVDGPVVIDNPAIIQGDPEVGATIITSRAPQASGGEVLFPDYTYAYQWQYIPWTQHWETDPSKDNYDKTLEYDPDDQVTDLYVRYSGSGLTPSSTLTGLTTTRSPGGAHDASRDCIIDAITNASGGIVQVTNISSGGKEYLPGDIIYVEGTLDHPNLTVVDTVNLPTAGQPPTSSDTWFDISGATSPNYVLEELSSLGAHSEKGYYVRCQYIVTSGSTDSAPSYSNIIGLIVD